MTQTYSETNDVQSVLRELGYDLKHDGNFFRARPIYRNSNNPTSLRIHKETGSFVDFSTGDSGTLVKLIKLTKGLPTNEEAETYLKDKNVSLNVIDHKPKLSFSKFYTFDDIGFCVNNFKYFESRGISEKTQTEFEIKYCTSGKMAGRAVVPMYSIEKEIIGFSGRTVFDNNNIKWKILGAKTETIFPAHLNLQEIRDQKSIILVEGISDVLKLWDCGIKNAVCLFGTSLYPKLKSFIISLNLDSIIIATNNEPDNNFIGNKAAEKVYNSLSRFYPKDKIKIKLPSEKDFGDMTQEQILEWQNA